MESDGEHHLPSETADGAGAGGAHDHIAVGRAAVVLVIAVAVAVVLLPSATRAPLRVVVTRPSTTTTTTPTTSASSSTTSTTAPPAPSRSGITVVVANGVGGVGSYAGDVTAVLAHDGYKTLAAQNATKTVTASAVYVVGSGTAADAAEVAADLQLPATDVQPTSATPPIPSSSGADVVVIVGPDLESRINDGSLKIPSATG